ncbi:hypothetical protein PoB_005738500, partial [Plakobranchus ocellatus]
MLAEARTVQIGYKTRCQCEAQMLRSSDHTGVQVRDGNKTSLQSHFTCRRSSR